MIGPYGAVTGAVVALGRALRQSGIATSVDQELVLLRALGEVDVRRRERFYWAARASFLHAPQDISTFDAVFERFWAGLPPLPGEQGAEQGESDPRMPSPQHGGESLPQFRLAGGTQQLLDGLPRRAAHELPSAAAEDGERFGERRGRLAAYSADEMLADAQPLRYQQAELDAVRRLAEELRRSAPERRCRRMRPARRGARLDLRRTVAGSLATGGELLRPSYESHSRTPRRLLLICDVSGSMERYSRALLAALQGVIRAGLKAETFVFATRLTRVTGPLGGRDAARALEQARAGIADWSGGTRIGAALAEFNRGYARRGLARGAIVVVASDGWDRGGPEQLARELDRLRRQARRLVWLNPRPTELGGQPLAVGMRTALPYVDDFVPGHDPGALGLLARLIGGIDAGRPGRRQRAPLSLPLAP